MSRFNTSLAANYPIDALKYLWGRLPEIAFTFGTAERQERFRFEAFYARTKMRLTSSRANRKTFAEYHNSFLEWFDRFGKDWVFYDIGANIGVYSFIAAKWAEARVYAFEPEINNGKHLSNAIILNGLEERMALLPFAVGAETGLFRLRPADIGPGFSGAEFGPAEPVANRPQYFHQTTVDALVRAGAIARPTAIKIDVDGPELQVLQGARATLADPAMRTVAIELNEHTDECRALLDGLGFREDESLADGINSFFWRA